MFFVFLSVNKAIFIDNRLVFRDVSSVSTTKRYQWNALEGMMLNADMAMYKVKYKCFHKIFYKT